MKNIKLQKILFKSEKLLTEAAGPKELEQKYQKLMAKHLDLLQEQTNLPDQIRPLLLALKDHPIGTEEGDHLRAKLNVLEERQRSIHLSIQENLKELKECEASLRKPKTMKQAA